MKIHAEMIREMLWTLQPGDMDPADRETLTLIATAPAERLADFREADRGRAKRAGDVLRAAGRLRRAAALLQRRGEALCNGLPQTWDPARRAWNMGLTDADTARLEADADRAREWIESAVRVIFGRAAEGIEIETGGDPRGHSVKLWRKGERDTGSPIWRG